MKILFAPLLLALASTPALAWDDRGHELIAKLTYDQLTPASQQWVNSLLTGGDYSESFVSGATWARRAIDSPFFQHRYRYEQVTGKECLANCLPTRASQAVSILQAANPNAAASQQPSYQEQQQALMALIYYVGELHQPLNAGLEHNGYGKNINGISYQGHTGNLYDWWNTQFVNGIEHNIAVSGPVGGGARPQPGRWLQESQRIAVNIAYGPRPRTNLTIEYVSKARATVKKQIILASTRLAQIINQLPVTQALERPSS